MVMKTPVLNPMRGTWMEGGRIWVIIAHDGAVNSLMGVVFIYKTRVAMAIAYVKGSM